MEPIIEKVERKALLDELTPEIYVRPSNNGANDIYIFDGNKKPNLLRELGRLREETFRLAGGGSGKNCDIDEFDIGKHPYLQLIVWNPVDQEMVGGYRFICCKDAYDAAEDKYHLSTTEIFDYSDTFKRDYINDTIELGRSWVQPQYQPSALNRKGLFSLDNLWDGLGALVIKYPEIKYFFGKITMYTNFNVEARDHILSFMQHYFPDNEKLIHIDSPVEIKTDCSRFIKSLEGLPYKEGHALLNSLVRDLGENIPPLFNSYMNISPSMRTFGTRINPHFGGVEETGIMITIEDIYPSKKDRHVQSYLNYLSEKEKS